MPELGRAYKLTPTKFYLVPFSNPNEGKYSMVQGLSSRFRSKYSMAFFCRRFPHCRQQSSPMIILWEKLWQCNRINIIGLEKWHHQTNTDFETYLLVKLQSIMLNSIPNFLKNASKLRLRNVHFQQQKIFLIFIFILRDLVFIYFRDSTYIFRLWHLVVDYITNN